MTDPLDEQPRDAVGQTPAPPVRLQATMDWESGSRWVGGDGPAPRGLSSNGGSHSTQDYLNDIYGRPIGLPADYAGPSDLPTEDALRNLGKSSLRIAPPRYSNVADTTARPPLGTGPSTRPPTNFYGAQQGFVSMVLGGLTELLVGFLPEELKRPIVNVASGVGAVADFPLEALTHVPLPFIPSTEEQFSMLEDNEGYAEVRAQMLADPNNAHWYMAQYVRAHKGDIAEEMRLPQLVAPLLAPDATLIERLFGVLEVGQNVVERTVVGLDEVDRIENILGGPIENLHPELAEIRRRYESGQWGPVGSSQARDRFYDELVSVGMGFSNEPFVQMLGEIFTDPIIIGGLGTGIAAKAVKVGALARRASEVSRLALADDATAAVRGAWSVATQAEEAIRISKGLTSKARRPHEAVYDIAQRLVNNPDPEIQALVRKAESALSPRDRGMLTLQPVVVAADRVSQLLNSPFRIFGNDGAAGIVRRRWGAKVYDGVFRAYNTAKVGAIHKAIGENAGVTEALGYAVAFIQRSMQQESMVKNVRVLGKGERPGFMPGALDPNVAADAMTTVENPAAAREAEHFVGFVRESFVPTIDPALTGKAREVAHEQAMDVFRERAAQQLAYVANIDIIRARSIVGKADADELSYFHLMHWGAMMRDFMVEKKLDLNAVTARMQAASAAARQAAGTPRRRLGAKARKAIDQTYTDISEEVSEVARLTFIGPDQLTMDDAAALSKAAKAGDVTAVVEAVNRYVQLRQNFWSKSMEPNDPLFLQEVATFLDEGIQKKAFVQAITPQRLQTLAPRAYAYMQQAMARVGGEGYRLGLAPALQDAWGEVLDGNGRLIGYRGWMDIDVSPTKLETPTRFDVMREQVMTPIRAENMLQQSRRKFIDEGVRLFGLDHAAAQTLWVNVRSASRNRLTTPRAFTHGEFAELVQQADIPYEMKKSLGAKGLSLLTAIALEGELRQMGLTSKLTGKLKTQTAAHGNYIAVLAEKVYPLVRFQLNPIFLAQEWLEPYFFNVLRGVKPGIKFSDENIAIQQTIELLNAAPHLADGLEAREFRTIGMVSTHRNFNETTFLGRMVGRLNRANVGRVVEVKELNFHRALRAQFAEKVIAAWDDISPGFYARVAAHYNDLARAAGERGVLSREEVTWRWLQSRGFKDPDRASTNITLWDGTKPNDFGKVDGIRKSYVARWYGAPSAAALKADIDAGLVDEWKFRDEMHRQGMDPAYATRAWQVARGISVEDLLDDVTRELPAGVPRPLAKELSRSLWEAGAVAQGISLDEFVARSFTGQTRWLDSAGRLPYNAYLQVAKRVAEENGITILTADDPLWTGALARSQRMLPADAHKDVKAHLNRATEVAEGTVKLPRTPVVSNFGDVPIGVRDIEEFKRAVLQAMDASSAEAAGYWYRDMGPMFASVVAWMSDEEVALWAKVMDEKMPSLTKVDTSDLTAVREELTARMLMAWGASQVQVSPRAGLAMVLRVMDDVTRGARPGAAALGTYTPQRTQLWRMLEDFEGNLVRHGLGPKLSDFIDSIMGNRQRSFTGNTPTTFLRRDGKAVPLQPAAMDVWMGRSVGLLDSEFLNQLARKVARDRQIGEDAALIEVQRELKVFARGEKESLESYRTRKAEFDKAHGITTQEEWSGKPSTAEYEWMLRRFNEMTDELNQGEGFLGRSYATGNEWTVADVQALEWVRLQKAVEHDPGGPLNMFHQNSSQVAFEIVPSANSPLYRSMGLHYATPDAQDYVTGEISRALAPIVAEATGASITRVIPGRGGWRSTRANGKTEYTYSPNTAWEVMGTDEQIQDAIDMVSYLTHQEMVMATTDVRPGIRGEMPTVSEGVNQWGIDFRPSAYDPETLDALGNWLEDAGMRWNGHMVASLEEGRAGIRTVYGADDMGDPATYVTVADKSDLAAFTEAIPIADDMRAKLEDGSWATEAGLESTVPVVIERRLNRVVSNPWHDWTADYERASALELDGVPQAEALRQEMGRDIIERLEGRGRGDVARALVDRDMATIQAVGHEALRRADPDAYATGAGQRHLRDYYPLDGSTREPRQPAFGTSRVPPRGEVGGAIPDDAYEQRRGRGWAGATAFDADLRADLYLNRTLADLTTLVHENFHTFARNLQPSAINAIHDVYAKATRQKKPVGKVLDRKAEEWVAAQFEQYMASGFTPDQSLRLHNIFNAYAAWGQQTGRAHGRYRPELQALFDSLNPNVHGKNMAVWDTQEFMMAEAARIAFVAAEEEAFRAHYYKRGRTWLERSANHPYLGMYPLSYMWGKVLPELMRFMVRKPFGIDAPFAGAALSNHVWNTLQLELNSESDISDFVKTMPEAIHILELMLPGNPWNLPVNIPAWVRRLAGKAAGQEPLTIEAMGAAMTDTLAYAYGPARAPGDILAAVGELMGEGREEVEPDEAEGIGLYSPEDTLAGQVPQVVQ